MYKNSINYTRQTQLATSTYYHTAFTQGTVYITEFVDIIALEHPMKKLLRDEHAL